VYGERRAHLKRTVGLDVRPVVFLSRGGLPLLGQTVHSHADDPFETAKLFAAAAQGRGEFGGTRLVGVCFDDLPSMYDFRDLVKAAPDRFVMFFLGEPGEVAPPPRWLDFDLIERTREAFRRAGGGKGACQAVLPGLLVRARIRGLVREWRAKGSPAVGGEHPPYRLSIAFVRDADAILPALDALHQEIPMADGRTKTLDMQTSHLRGRKSAMSCKSARAVGMLWQMASGSDRLQEVVPLIIVRICGHQCLAKKSAESRPKEFVARRCRWLMQTKGATEGTRQSGWHLVRRAVNDLSRCFQRFYMCFGRWPGTGCTGVMENG
jgi:hypothetical protein